MEMYPVLEINRNITANRFYAFPIIGFLAKIIMLIPIYLWLFLVIIALFFVNVIINPFVVLFTGKYWSTSYNLSIGFMRFSTKVSAYLFGLTDKYPYFKLSIPDFKLDMACPEKPSKFFAVPLLGGFVRFLLIVPFYLFLTIISYAASYGMIGSFAKALFKGEYPESTHGLIRDFLRINNASIGFMLGLSDEYPSFEIDLKNKKGIKFMLICFAVIVYLINSGASAFTSALNNYSKKPTQFQNYQLNQTSSSSSSTTNSAVTDQELKQLMQQIKDAQQQVPVQ